MSKYLENKAAAENEIKAFLDRFEDLGNTITYHNDLVAKIQGKNNKVLAIYNGANDTIVRDLDQVQHTELKELKKRLDQARIDLLTFHSKKRQELEASLPDVPKKRVFDSNVWGDDFAAIDKNNWFYKKAVKQLENENEKYYQQNKQCLNCGETLEDNKHILGDCKNCYISSEQIQELQKIECVKCDGTEELYYLNGDAHCIDCADEHFQAEYDANVERIELEEVEDLHIILTLKKLLNK